MEKLGQITIIAEREVKSVEMDFDVDDKTLDIIARHALRIISDDKKALFEYALRKAFESFAEGESTWTLKKTKKDSSKRSSLRSRSRKS